MQYCSGVPQPQQEGFDSVQTQPTVIGGDYGFKKSWSVTINLGPVYLKLSLEASMNIDVPGDMQFEFVNGQPDSVDMHVPGSNLKLSVPSDYTESMDSLGAFCGQDDCPSLSSEYEKDLGNHKFRATVTATIGGDFSVTLEWEHDFRGGVQAFADFTAELYPNPNSNIPAAVASTPGWVPWFVGAAFALTGSLADGYISGNPPPVTAPQESASGPQSGGGPDVQSNDSDSSESVGAGAAQNGDESYPGGPRFDD